MISFFLSPDIGGGFGVSGLGLTVKSPGPGRVRACVEAVLVYELMSVLEQRLVSENLIQPFKEVTIFMSVVFSSSSQWASVNISREWVQAAGSIARSLALRHSLKLVCA